VLGQQNMGHLVQRVDARHLAHQVVGIAGDGIGI